MNDPAHLTLGTLLGIMIMLLKLIKLVQLMLVQLPLGMKLIQLFIGIPVMLSILILVRLMPGIHMVWCCFPRNIFAFAFPAQSNSQEAGSSPDSSPRPDFTLDRVNFRCGWTIPRLDLLLDPENTLG